MDKRCVECNKTKPVSLFPVNRVVDGKPIYRRKCKICHAVDQREKDKTRREARKQHAMDKGGYFQDMNNCVKAMRKRWISER